jgi:hypothetical protein
MGFLRKLQIIPANTKFLWSIQGPEGRKFDTVPNRQEDFARLINKPKLSYLDYYNPESELAVAIENMHYGDMEVPKTLSREGIFAVNADLRTGKMHGQDLECWGSMIDVDCHGKEAEVQWEEIRASIAEFTLSKGLTCFWNRSRGGGLHLWFPFTEAVPVNYAITFVTNIDKAFKNHSLYEFHGITPEIRKTFKTEFRPNEEKGSVVFPDSFIYKNPLFYIENIKGDEGGDPVDREEFETVNTLPLIKTWLSSTKRGKPKAEIEVKEAKQEDGLRSLALAHLQKRNIARPKEEWYEDNLHKDVSTERLRALAAADPYFAEFSEEIQQVAPCILGRTMLGPQQSQEWGHTIFNFAKSCLAVCGFEEAEDVEKSLDLLTLIMNHPNVDWEDRPRDREYYRTTGSLNGALKSIREGKTFSCHSANIESMKEHCRPAECMIARGGFCSTAYDNIEITEVPFLFELVIIDDPFEIAERRSRFRAPRYMSSDVPYKEQLIELTINELGDPFRFQQAVLERSPPCYYWNDFFEDLSPIFATNSPKGRRAWQIFWSTVLQNPTPVRRRMLLHTPTLQAIFNKHLQRENCQRIEVKRGGSLILEKIDDVPFIHFHSTLISQVFRMTATTLRFTRADIERCIEVYMTQFYEATPKIEVTDFGPVKWWTIKYDTLLEKGVLPERLEMQINTLITKKYTTVPNVTDISQHRDKRRDFFHKDTSASTGPKKEDKDDGDKSTH